ncbi:hypothetical protein [Halobacillus sp. Marseille-Q1614]|uniref:hypothetical protein n=1 Tax=Halobacillus sp. Marseille-Q1614 TaxID=2709134 RepID=UPI00156D58CD|nr:hypothetical protein [Halobacillus sp. Marseille-Q1614]
MELLPIIKNAGFTQAQFTDNDGNDCSFLLETIHSNDQLFHHLKIVPTTVQYFPLERHPYLYCIEKEKTLKIKLLKQVL